MSIESLKFIPADFVGNDISSLPDDPSSAGYTAKELKERFDKVAKEMIALGAFNELIDLLRSEEAASELGSADGNIQLSLDKSVRWCSEDVKYIRLSSDMALEVSADGKSWKTTASGEHVVVDNLTFDAEPTKGSENPVTSDGIFSALAGMMTGKTVCLSAAGWAEGGSRTYTQTVSVPGVVSDKNLQLVICSPEPSAENLAAYGASVIVAADQGDGTLTFEAENLPERDLTVNVAVFNCMEVGE